MSHEMPAELRTAVIDLLADALVADVQKHPELYFSGDPKVPEPTGETVRGLARFARRPAGAGAQPDSAEAVGTGG
jgi:hypothetical protein